MQNAGQTCLSSRNNLHQLIRLAAWSLLSRPSHRNEFPLPCIVFPGDTMKRFQKNLLFLVLCSVLIWFFADAAHLRTAAAEALSLCARSVIPALFPFLVISTLLVSLGFGEWISPLLSGLMTSLFHLPGHAGSAFVLGLVAGYPVGAQTAAALYRQKQLTQDEAERLLVFCNNSNPVFLISVLGLGVFNSIRIGIWLWLIHVGSALLVGLTVCRSRRTTVHRRIPQPHSLQPDSFPSAFVAAVRGAATGMLSICGFVTLFYVLAAPLSELSVPLGPILVGFLELFSLTPLLSANPFGFILAAGCSGWGGLSVLCQTAAVLEGSGLSTVPCMKGKTVQGLLSAGLAALLAPWLFP